MQSGISQADRTDQGTPHPYSMPFPPAKPKAKARCAPMEGQLLAIPADQGMVILHLQGQQ